MANLNEVKLIGRIGKEPEIATTNDGRSILKFSLATTDRWTDKVSNEKKEKTEWHKVVIYNTKISARFEKQKQELTGALVYVCGKLRYEKWVNNAGVEQKSTSIVIDSFSGQFFVLLKKNKNLEEGGRSNDDSSSSSDTLLHDFDLSDDSDEIPF